MGQTKTDSANGNSGTHAREPKDEKQPIGLPYVFILGFIFSLVVVGGLIWLAAAYEVRAWAFWNVEPRMAPDRFFGVIRNGVTAAAALGVGVTLFFSYRRQQTSERTLRISADAQRTAAEAQKTGIEVQKTAAAAQEVANQNLELSQRKHNLEVAAALRDRYARISEQLASEKTAVRLAGLHALGALADERFDRDELSEQQICIDLFCSVLRTEQADKEEGANQFSNSPFLEAGWQILTERMGGAASTRQSWSSRRLDLQRAVIPDIDGWEVTGGQVNLKAANASPFIFSYLQLISGSVDIDNLQRPTENAVFGIFELTASGGVLSMTGIDSAINGITFVNSKFEGTHMIVMDDVRDLLIHFKDCTFSDGKIRMIFRPGEKGKIITLNFEGCIFKKAIFEVGSPDSKSTIETVFDQQCEFIESAAHMQANPRSAILIGNVESPPTKIVAADVAESEVKGKSE
jgi:hypothetical protein